MHPTSIHINPRMLNSSEVDVQELSVHYCVLMCYVNLQDDNIRVCRVVAKDTRPCSKTRVRKRIPFPIRKQVLCVSIACQTLQS